MELNEDGMASHELSIHSQPWQKRAVRRRNNFVRQDRIIIATVQKERCSVNIDRQRSCTNCFSIDGEGDCVGSVVDNTF